MRLLGMSYITFACPCSDWPVFGDLDNMGPRDHDHMDNHRVSGKERRGVAGCHPQGGVKEGVRLREAGSPAQVCLEHLSDCPAGSSSFWAAVWNHRLGQMVF